MDTFHRNLGRRVRQWREFWSWSQEDLAKRVKQNGAPTLYQQRIDNIERGSRGIRAFEVVVLARVLRVPISHLLGVPDHE